MVSHFRRRVSALFWRMLNIYLHAHVSRASAQLAYYLLLSIFPILIVISSILGMFPLTSSTNLMEMVNSLPAAIGGVLRTYLYYVERNRSVALLSGGIIITLTSSSAAFRGLMDIFGEVFGQRVRGGVIGLVFSLLLSVMLIVMIYGGLLIVLLGDFLLDMIQFLLEVPVLHYGWRLAQLALPFLMLFLFLAIVYRLTARTPRHKRTIFPGAFLGALVLVAATNLFSSFMGVSTRYTTVYGSLAAVIILMVWLFICANILILGNIFNYAIAENQEQFGTMRLPRLNQNTKK